MAARLNCPDHVYRVPCEVDFQKFRPTGREEAREILGLDLRKKYLLFAAKPANPVKRFPLARDAASLLASRDPDVELVVVFKEPQERLALYMSACDALVFPSYHEGSPNIVKQAMACNLPIVATDVGDVREVIAGTDGCFVCPPRVEDFAEKLRSILQTRPRTDGRRRIARFDPAVITRRLIEVYEETIERFHCRRRAVETKGHGAGPRRGHVSQPCPAERVTP